MDESAILLAGDTQQARSVLELDDRWVAAFNRADVETIVSLYDPDVVLMPPDEPDLHGRAAVAEWMQAFFRENTARQILRNEEVFADGDWAFLRGRFELEITPRAGGGAVRARGKHLVIWRRRRGDGWLASRDIWNLER